MQGERNGGRVEEQSSRSGARVAAHGGQSMAKVIQSGEARYPLAGGANRPMFLHMRAAAARAAPCQQCQATNPGVPFIQKGPNASPGIAPVQLGRYALHTASRSVFVSADVVTP